MRKPNYSLLKQAYAIIDGIPDDAISLNGPAVKRGKSLAEGTVATPGGWLALHPKFQELGLSVSKSGKELAFKGEKFNGTYSEQLSKVFGIPVEETAKLFAVRGRWEHDPRQTDKSIWLHRIKNYLRAQGQLKEETAPTEAPIENAEDARIHMPSTVSENLPPMNQLPSSQQNSRA